MIRMGVDPTGGLDPDSPNIIWTGTGANVKGFWTELVSEGVAQESSITVFLDVDNPRSYNTNGYFDDFVLKIGRGFYLATPTPTHTPFSTATPAPSLTPSPVPTYDHQPLLALYDPNLEKPLVEMVNTTAQPLTVMLGEAITVTIEAGGEQTRELEPGTYDYTASVPGLPPLSGRLAFERHYRYTWTFWLAGPPPGTPTPTATFPPTPPPQPTATPRQPLVAVYEPELTGSLVEIINGTGQVLTVALGEEVITIPSGGRQEREIEPGTYSYTASVPGFAPASGVVVFKRQYRYTWTFWLTNP